MSQATFEQARAEIGELRPVHPPIGSGKFFTVSMRDLEGNSGFLKCVKDPDSHSWEDLENEVLWSQQHGELLGDEGILVPRVLQHDPDFKWVLFELLDRPSQGPYRTAGNVGPATDAAIAVFKLRLKRPPLTNLEEWYQDRISRFAGDAPDLFRGNHNKNFALEKIQALGKGAIDTTCLTPGIIHGDLKDENILLTAKGTALVDGEFGTLQAPPSAKDGGERRRTEHDKPRFHDIAYYYHLLWQTAGSIPARGFLTTMKRALQEEGLVEGREFERELTLSIIERTLSMANHFICNPSTNLQRGEDPRRRRAPRYASLLIKSLSDLE